METPERRPEKAAAPPDAAGHRGADTRPEELLEQEPRNQRHPPLAGDPSSGARKETPGARRRLPPAFPLGSTALLLLLLAAVLALVAYLVGLF